MGLTELIAYTHDLKDRKGMLGIGDYQPWWRRGQGEEKERAGWRGGRGEGREKGGGIYQERGGSLEPIYVPVIRTGSGTPQ